MSSYAAHPDTPSRAKAIAGVIAVHAALAFVILTGLNVDTVRKAVEQMKTIAIIEPEPPAPPPPQAQPERAKKEAGAPAKRAEPTQVVAPEQRIPAPSPIPAAKVAGQGSASTSGAAVAGSGTGAGGTGSGPGGGGRGDFSGFSPAVLIRNLNHGDYRPLAAGRLERGSAMVSLTVDTRGSPGNCRVVRSSGDKVVDSGLCPLLTRRLRFRPARNASGEAVSYTLQYVANWRI